MRTPSASIGTPWRAAVGARWAWFVRSLRSLCTFFGSFLGSSTGIRVISVSKGPVSEDLAREIEVFERRIATAYVGGTPTTCDQGRDYSRFWRAIGPGRAFVARDRAGRVLGVCAAAGIRLRVPGGRTSATTYLAHLRVLPECRAGLTLPSLVARTIPTIMCNGFSAIGFSSDMAGFNPGKVSKNLGLPAFRPRAVVRLIAFDCHPNHTGEPARIREVTEREVRRMYHTFTAGFIASRGGTPSMRSVQAPRWVIAEDGSACGCIEDYHRARRWRTGEQGELIQSHVSFFGWRDAESAARFVRACIAITASMGVPRLRICLDDRLAGEIIGAIGAAPQSEFRWTVYGAGLGRLPDAPWSLHPTEF